MSNKTEYSVYDDDCCDDNYVLKYVTKDLAIFGGLMDITESNFGELDYDEICNKRKNCEIVKNKLFKILTNLRKQFIIKNDNHIEMLQTLGEYFRNVCAKDDINNGINHFVNKKKIISFDELNSNLAVIQTEINNILDKIDAVEIFIENIETIRLKLNSKDKKNKKAGNKKNKKNDNVKKPKKSNKKKSVDNNNKKPKTTIKKKVVNSNVKAIKIDNNNIIFID